MLLYEFVAAARRLCCRLVSLTFPVCEDLHADSRTAHFDLSPSSLLSMRAHTHTHATPQREKGPQSDDGPRPAAAAAEHAGRRRQQ